MGVKGAIKDAAAVLLVIFIARQLPLTNQLVSLALYGSANSTTGA